jgi:outer membrane protein TolC
VTETEVKGAAIQRDTAEVALEQTEAAYRQAEKALAIMLDIPLVDADRLELRGAVRVEIVPRSRPTTWAASRCASGLTLYPTGSG